MKSFAELLQSLNQSEDPDHEAALLRKYFSSVRNEDKSWALFFLSGHRSKVCASPSQLRRWAAELAGLPLWLIDESRRAVGDLAETIALVLPSPANQSSRTLSDWMRYLRVPAGAGEREKQRRISEAWQAMPVAERIILNRILTASIRSPIPQKVLYRALSLYVGVSAAAIAHNIKRDWHPDGVSFEDLITPGTRVEQICRTYPFFNEDTLTEPVESLGNPADWQVEWVWNGVRAQLIKRQGELLLWSLDGELFTEELPGLVRIKNELPDGTVLDGVILAYKDGTPRQFPAMDARLGRSGSPAEVLRKDPVLFVACDIIERRGDDIRDMPLRVRRRALEELLRSAKSNALRLSPAIDFSRWEDVVRKREHARERGATGVMLKRLESTYHNDGKKGDWWKWKAEPHSINAVLLYAERGIGEPPDLYSCYAFAVWKNESLVPCAKAWSGLSEEEVAEIDAFVRTHTTEKFGPVCTVAPELVFEIGFEEIEYSRRRKSGVILRQPWIMQWHRELAITQAGTVEQLHSLAGVPRDNSAFSLE